MTWSPYSSSDPLPPPPRGFERALINLGDTLQGLANESGVSAEDIAQANGVAPHHRSVPTCTWEADLSAMILASGGKRNDFDENEPNNCEPGLGFPAFVAGQQQNLPIGLRKAVSSSAPATAKPKLSTGAKLALVFVAAAAVGAAARAAHNKKSTTRKVAAYAAA